MTAAVLAKNGKPKKTRRKASFPHSILDRKTLLEALDDKGITLKRIHIDGFYQALHRQHYPSLPAFVETYYKHERKEKDNNVKQDFNQQKQQQQLPLKNAVTNRKNKNRQQLPKVFLDFLVETDQFVTLTSKVQQQLTSSDKSTTKLIVELHDGQVVESVLMRYDRKGLGRASLCVSSQCGCAMGCTFCATGTMGLSGNLQYFEILEQLIHADKILANEYMSAMAEIATAATTTEPKKKLDLVRNVVFMGMGEPLDNYNNVVEACKAMMDRKRWNLAHGRVTVSTVGLISQIRKLTNELPQVSLALSLHAPNQQMRTNIVPTASRFPIEGLIDALDNHMMAYLTKRVNGEGYTTEERIKESTRRRAMIEYVMLQGETSSLECAHQLGKLCENRHLVVNLIPYNATDVKDKLQCPSNEHMQRFRSIVASYGTFCTIRRTMGADIASACGQLVTKQDDNSQQEHQSAVDIEDVVGRTTTTTSKGRTQASNEKVVNDKTRGVVTVNDSNPNKLWSLESLSNEDLDRMITALSIASAVATSCFIVSSVLFVRKR